MSKEEKTKKGFRMPHTFVIIFIIILVAVAFTWLIPAGEYARFENAQGIKVIDPSQFSLINRSPVNPLLITSYIVNAFIKNADLIMVILFSGGAFHIITQTGALQAVIAKLAKKFSNPDSVSGICADLYHSGGEYVYRICTCYGDACACSWLRFHLRGCDYHSGRSDRLFHGNIECEHHGDQPENR